MEWLVDGNRRIETITNTDFRLSSIRRGKTRIEKYEYIYIYLYIYIYIYISSVNCVCKCAGGKSRGTVIYSVLIPQQSIFSLHNGRMKTYNHITD